MKKLLLLVFGLVLLIACSKDKYTSTPQIKIKSINPTIVPKGGTMDITLSFTDKEGDLDSVWIYKTRLNQTVVQTLRDTLPYAIPTFPNNSSGDISLSLDYSLALQTAITPPNIPGSNPPTPQPDTLLLRIVVGDRAGHKSDTARTGVVVVIR